MCDNCKHPRERAEGKEHVELLLKAIVELQEMQKAKHVCAFISGNLTSDIKTYKHDQLVNFGKGSYKMNIFGML